VARSVLPPQLSLASRAVGPA